MTLEQLKALSLTEIKAIAFDEFAKLGMCQKNLEVLNQLIAEKSQPASVVPEVSGEVVA